MDDLQTFRTMYLAGWISLAQWRKLYNQEGWKKRELDKRNRRLREKNTARIKKGMSEADIKNEALKRWKIKNPMFYSEVKWRQYCCEPLENIENYDLAKKDGFLGWVVHHRLQTHTVSGQLRVDKLSVSDLMKMDLYYNRPASELICLREDDHVRIHFLGRPWASKV